jgi:hypothetical protein
VAHLKRDFGANCRREKRGEEILSLLQKKKANKGVSFLPLKSKYLFCCPGT